MGGKVLEYEAKWIKREGLIEGREEGLIEGREEGLMKGREEGREEGIRGTVSVLRELGIPVQTILEKIQEEYHLSPEVSKNIYKIFI